MGSSGFLFPNPHSFVHSSSPVRFIPIILLILLLRASAADSTGVVVRVWQSQDGLPSNVVRSLVQSSDGHLWMATAEGVADAGLRRALEVLAQNILTRTKKW